MNNDKNKLLILILKRNENRELITLIKNVLTRMESDILFNNGDKKHLESMINRLRKQNMQIAKMAGGWISE